MVGGSWVIDDLGYLVFGQKGSEGDVPKQMHKEQVEGWFYRRNTSSLNTENKWKHWVGWSGHRRCIVTNYCDNLLTYLFAHFP